jgi:hypothetical protein
VLVARELDQVTAALREQLSLGEPFSDPGVGYFGLKNAVFALGDTFLEVVSPVQPDAAAGRLLERRGADGGYMVMFQVDGLPSARQRAAAHDVREVFEVDLEDIAEVHLHPADMRGAIVSLSEPQPPAAWRWGGPDWTQRSVELTVAGVKLGVAEPDEVRERWSAVLGAPLSAAGVELVSDPQERGVTEVSLAGSGAGDRDPVEIGGVRFVFTPNQEEP